MVCSFAIEKKIFSVDLLALGQSSLHVLETVDISSLQMDSLITSTLFNNSHYFFYPRSRTPFTGIILDKVQILFSISRTCECVSIFCVQGLRCHLFFPRSTSNYPTRKSKCWCRYEWVSWVICAPILLLKLDRNWPDLFASFTKPWIIY